MTNNHFETLQKHSFGSFSCLHRQTGITSAESVRNSWSRAARRWARSTCKINNLSPEKNEEVASNIYW